MKRSKRFFSLLLAFMMTLCIFPASADAANGAYNPTGALNYAKTHWNDGKGLCAEFVSDCISRGGLTSWNRRCTNLFNQLNREVVGKTATVTYLKTNGSYIRPADNAGKVQKGDILFWRCKNCPGGGNYQHVALVSDTSGAYVKVYQHNGAVNNQPAWVAGNCYDCGRSYTRYGEMICVHFTRVTSNSANQNYIKLSGCNAPGNTHVFGRYFDLAGWVESSSRIVSVRGYIKNLSTGKVEPGFDVTDYPSSQSYKILGSKVDRGLHMEQLRANVKYAIHYTAINESGNRAEWESGPFLVSSVISWNGVKGPSQLWRGNYWTLQGQISSTSPLLWVRGAIIDRNGKECYAKYQEITKITCAYNLAGSSIDMALLFNKLPRGNGYKITYTVRDRSGHTDRWTSNPFTVK